MIKNLLIWAIAMAMLVEFLVARSLGSAMLCVGLRTRRWLDPEFCAKASLIAIRLKYWSPVEIARKASHDA